MDREQIEALVQAAARVREHAYAPYSEYRVGAAVIAADGRIFAGCNVENASFGLSVCAERNALAAAVAAGSRDIVGLAVVTSSRPPATPCGACRQVSAEFGDFDVVLANLVGDRTETSVRELLPSAFDGGELDRDRTG